MLQVEMQPDDETSVVWRSGSPDEVVVYTITDGAGEERSVMPVAEIHDEGWYTDKVAAVIETLTD